MSRTQGCSIAAKTRVYRDRVGVYVGVLHGHPDIAAVGTTAEEARIGLLAALGDLGLMGRFSEPLMAELGASRRSPRPTKVKV
jgi:hypothetical protein